MPRKVSKTEFDYIKEINRKYRGDLERVFPLVPRSQETIRQVLESETFEAYQTQVKKKNPKRPPQKNELSKPSSVGFTEIVSLQYIVNKLDLMESAQNQKWTELMGVLADIKGKQDRIRKRLDFLGRKVSRVEKVVREFNDEVEAAEKLVEEVIPTNLNGSNQVKSELPL